MFKLLMQWIHHRSLLLNRPAPVSPPRRPQPGPNPEPAPAPQREPNPSPAPAPTPQPSPGRPSPRPGRRPLPVTDPKNYLAPLSPRYFHNLAPPLNELLRDYSPLNPHIAPIETFSAEVLQERTNTEMRCDHIYSANPINLTKLPQQIKTLQRGKEDPLLDLIHTYLQEIFGELYQAQITHRLDLGWHNPYDPAPPIGQSASSTAKPNAPARASAARASAPPENPGPAYAENQRPELQHPDGQLIDIDYVGETLLRSELYYWFIQGFGIIYMDGFFRMMARELRALDPLLPTLYQLFHLNGHANHHLVVEDVIRGKKIDAAIEQRMESNHSEGRVWHHVDPLIDPDSGNITAINTSAHARSEIGVVLAHEALKGAFQILTPWARIHQNYLATTERNIIERAAGGYWAEMRQFSLGPSYFPKFIASLEGCRVPVSLSSPHLYHALQNFLLLPLPALQIAHRNVMQNNRLDLDLDQTTISRLTLDPATAG